MRDVVIFDSIGKKGVPVSISFLNNIKASKTGKCREILPPEPFDFKQPAETPVVFLAGAIDQGKAEDWQANNV